MISVADSDNIARDAAFARTEVWQYQRRDVPICPQLNHGVMRAYMTRGRITYYACRVVGCTCRSKSIVQIVS